MNLQRNTSLVYLKWLNSLGGFDSWYFGNNNYKSNNISDSIQYNTLDTDFKTERRILRRNDDASIVVFAFEKSENADGFTDLFKSDNIFIYQNYVDETGATVYFWQKCFVDVKSKELKSNNNFFKFSFEINYE